MADEAIEIAVEIIGEVVGGVMEVAAGSNSTTSRRGCRRPLFIGFIVIAAVGTATYFLL